MLCWRIARRRYADLSGAGGLAIAGRWHNAGRAVIYASTSIALAALEYAVHSAERPAESVLMTIELPDEAVLTIEARLLGPLPENWPFVPEQTRQIGTSWLESNVSIALQVPSIVIPRERNLILNPAHPRFGEVKLGEVVPFFFDPRIFNTGQRRRRRPSSP